MTLNKSFPPFGNILTAMVTPFKKDGKVDYELAVRLANHIIENGSDGIVLCGTTGESPTLTWDEQHQLFVVIRNSLQSKAKILIGTGSNSTSEAVEATQKAFESGADGALVVVPYYNKPPQDGLYEHFKDVANAAPKLLIVILRIVVHLPVGALMHCEGSQLKRQQTANCPRVEWCHRG